MTDLVPPSNLAKTLGELKKSGWKSQSVKEEIRKNAVVRITAGEELFSGVLGFEETVMPQLENALLAGHDIVFLGERGQAKTRIIRSLIFLLDEWMPIVAGSEINDDPYAPVSRQSRELVAQHGDATQISWVHRSMRYGEKLATPDTSIADLIGEVDPIKVAEGRYLSDELTLHYGLVPRCNRGIFAINELPDLSERIQVGLLNVLEERDIQVRGYKIRLPLDIMLVAVQVRTPRFMEEIIATVSHLARANSQVNQRSGVSVRLTTSNQELLCANAVRRALHAGETDVAPRVSDLDALAASTAGKIEIDAVEDGRESQIFQQLVRGAVLQVFKQHSNLENLRQVAEEFSEGVVVQTGEDIASADYVVLLEKMPALRTAVNGLINGDESPAVIASAIEFVLEGLHLSKRLNKDSTAQRAVYRAKN